MIGQEDHLARSPGSMVPLAMPFALGLVMQQGGIVSHTCGIVVSIIRRTLKSMTRVTRRSRSAEARTSLSVHFSTT